MSSASWHPRILMTVDTVGGVWSFAIDLARELVADGAEVLLCSFGGRPSASQRAEVAALCGLHLAASSHALEWQPERRSSAIASCAWLASVARVFAPDLVHCNTYIHAGMSWPVPVVLVAHSCVCTWYRAVRGEAAPADEWSLYRHWVRRAITSADRVVAPTTAFLEALQAEHGKAADARVIANGCDLEHCRPEGGDGLILAAGRMWDEAKNLQLLEVIAPRSPWPLAVAGSGSVEGVAPTTARALRPLGRLWREELWRHMRRAAIFVHPAKYEPFGLAPLEAAANGCALVLADIPTLREVWNDAALFCPPDDAEAWCATLTDLVADGPRRRRLTELAVCRAARFDRRRTGVAYRDLYEELLAAPAVTA